MSCLNGGDGVCVMQCWDQCWRTEQAERLRKVKGSNVGQNPLDTTFVAEWDDVLNLNLHFVTKEGESCASRRASPPWQLRLRAKWPLSMMKDASSSLCASCVVWLCASLTAPDPSLLDLKHASSKYILRQCVNHYEKIYMMSLSLFLLRNDGDMPQ